MGASIIRQCLQAAISLLSELTNELVPVVLVRWIRLHDGLEPGTVGLELARVVDAPGVTHLTYHVTRYSNAAAVPRTSPCTQSF